MKLRETESTSSDSLPKRKKTLPLSIGLRAQGSGFRFGLQRLGLKVHGLGIRFLHVMMESQMETDMEAGFM